MNSPFFSIIIPTYNREALLPRMIHSILAQDISDWELIIVDDCSPGDTLAVVNSFNDPRIRYTRTPRNSEKSGARNFGLDITKGKYVCFVDDDDYLLPNHLSAFYKKIKETESEIAAYWCGIKIEQVDKRIDEMNISDHKYKNNIEFVLQEVISTQEACFHREILTHYRFNINNYRCEDTELWFRVLQKYPLYASGEKTYVIVEHTGRSNDLNNEHPILYRLEYLKTMVREDNYKNISKEVANRLICNTYIRLANHYEFKSKNKEAIHALINSLRLDFSYRRKQLIYSILMNFKPTASLIRLIKGGK